MSEASDDEIRTVAAECDVTLQVAARALEATRFGRSALHGSMSEAEWEAEVYGEFLGEEGAE